MEKTMEIPHCSLYPQDQKQESDSQVNSTMKRGFFMQLVDDKLLLMCEDAEDKGLLE